MQQRMSTNKWSLPVHSNRSYSFDENGTSNMEIDKKHDPCVQFISGTSISTSKRNSRSNSMSSSGNDTPIRLSGRTSPDRTEQRKPSVPTFDPCVSFTAGKPNVGTVNETPEPPAPTGVSHLKLDNALKKVQGRRGYSVGTRLAPKPIQGVTKAGAVSNIAGLFSGGNVNNNTELTKPTVSRKQSATCVLRDDFQIRSNILYKNKTQDPKEDEEEVNINTNVNTPGKHKLPEPDAPPPVSKRPDKKNSLPLHTRKFSSSTSQATLVESQVVSPEDNVFSVVNSVSWKEDNQKQLLASPPSYRKRNLLNTERKSSLSSSVENSDDDEGSHVDSSEESELNNWKGRRRSYLAAAGKQNDINSNTLDATEEADDEDSDVTINNTFQKASQKPVEGDAQNVPKVIKEGPLNRKHEKANDRRRPVSRTWKPIYAVLKGHRLFCYKEGGSDGDDEIIQPIPVRSSIIEIASNYVKRKNVFRMVTSHDNEYLFQAENSTSMMEWVTALRDANPDKESLMRTTASVKQEQCTSSGQSPPTSKGPSVKEKRGGLSIKKATFGFGASKKGHHLKYTPPVTVQLTEEQLNLPGKTFGTYLSDVPMSAELKNVPAILYNCCTIIEEKGINQTGLYRVPGNSATSNCLKDELDTKEPEDVDWNDEKWFDLNNICTLVKLFLRELADPLIPNSMYSKFIQANRIKQPNMRLKTIKQLVFDLPEYHFESIQFLIHHLKALADNCSRNLMTEKNIAVILAPNIVHTSEVSSLVQDMSDQIQIVELMIRQCEWMFDDSEDCASIPEESETNSESIIAHSMTQNLMLSLNNMNNQHMNDSESDIGSKKGNKFSNLKSNLSMRLRSNNKNVSPRSPKKSVPHSDHDESDGEDTSESIPTSPTLELKNDRGKPFSFKSSKEMMQQSSGGGTSLPQRRSSHTGVTKTGSFQPHSDIQIQFKHRSPDMSPQLNRNNILRATTTKKELSEKTLNRLNQMSVSRTDESSKSIGKDEGSDSGFVSDSTAQSCRKASLDSLSPPLSIPPSRYNVHNYPSTSTSDEHPSSQTNRDNGSTIYVKAAGKGEVPNENVIDSEPCVVNRRTTRRKLTASPGVSKRGICTIMPGDDSFQEKVSALIDPEYRGQMKEIAHSEMNKPNIVEPEAPAKRSFAPITLSLNVKSSNEVSLNLNQPKNGPNAEWWLSDNCAVAPAPPPPRRQAANRPKDKTSALNIITNAIANKKRTDCDIKPSSVDSTGDVDNRDDMLTRRIGNPMKLPYKVELSCRVDHYNHQMEECQRKCTNVLGSNIHNDVRVPQGESKSEQIQYYLDQVSKLLDDTTY